MKLIMYRGMAGMALLALMLFWMEPSFYPSAGKFIHVVAFLYMLLLVLQGIAHWWARSSGTAILLFEFASDVLVAGLLVYATQGISSPFSFLLGLIVLTSGTVGRVMLPLVVSVLACISYLTAVYAYASWQGGIPLDAADALHALLQTSAIFLVGGVMAFIARRHMGLRSSSDLAIRQHRKLKGLHSRVMSSMSEGVIVLDGRLEAYEMNAAARSLLASPPDNDEALAGSFVRDVPGLYAWLTENSGHDFHAEYPCAGRNLLVTAKSLDVPAALPGEPSWLLTLVDISEIRRLEARLIEHEKMAALGQMSAMLAHEIRNPIQTMAQGLELMRLDVDHRDTVQDILHDEMMRLNRLVTMMLDYSRPLAASPEWIEMETLLMAAINQTDLEQHDIGWQCDIDQLYIDPDHFRLVLDNLLSNALKHRVNESLVKLNLRDVDGHWRLKVCNEGEIPDTLRSKLFQPYVSGGRRGVGLGLSTIKHVCDMNDWTVQVEESDGLVCFVVEGPGLSDGRAKKEDRDG